MSKSTVQGVPLSSQGVQFGLVLKNQVDSMKRFGACQCFVVNSFDSMQLLRD